jgi:serine/threonine protein kinase
MISFKTVQVFKDQILGVGSYGTVYKAKCDDLPCAAKVLHPTMLASHPQAIAHKKNRIAPIRKFEQEIELLSAIRHPYVVQYLGTHQDSDTGLPILLMELMDHNLTWFLSSHEKPLPYCVQINICHDISVALSFLHSNDIIHRDLSSNNVLLIGNARAKVTDFGVAKLSSFEMSTLSKNPGTDAYMPPEAMKLIPEYTEKIDCFSFGVLVVQIVTRLAPKPAERLKEVVYHGHSGSGSRKVYEIASEIERRQSHITKIDSHHPLLPIALGCLDDQDIKRPTAHELCASMETLRNSSEYEISKGICKAEEKYGDTESSILQIQQHINEQHTHEIIHKDESMALLQEENRKLKNDIRHLSVDKEENKKQLVDESRKLQLVIDELESQVRDNMCLTCDINFDWKKQSKAPCEMFRSCDPAVCAADNMAYFRPAHTNNIYEFHCDKSPHFFQLSDCPVNSCSMVMIDKQLTVIGGYSHGDGCLNKLFTFKVNGFWTEKFPPMPTKRCWTTALCTKTVLIVVGGSRDRNQSKTFLKTVEVMNIATHEWYTAADIPEGLFSVSATICGDSIYMLGGKTGFYIPSRSVYTCSLSALIQSCSFTPVKQNVPDSTASTSMNNTVWRRLADLPVELSTCVSFQGQLLAVGGIRYKTPTNNIYLYDTITDSWNVVNEMSIPRHVCLAAVFSSRELIIIGGYKQLDLIEIATLSIKMMPS